MNTWAGFSVCRDFVSRYVVPLRAMEDFSAPVFSLFFLSVVSESESCITSNDWSACSSWNKAPVWGLRPDFYYCQTFADLLIWDVLSDERTGLSFTVAPGPRQRSHFRVPVPWDSWPYCTISDSIETSLFVASYDSQGYGGGIRPRLHMGALNQSTTCPPFITPDEPKRANYLQQFVCSCPLFLRSVRAM
jgi:hypothetical protein